jgi:hypothetical protein
MAEPKRRKLTSDEMSMIFDSLSDRQQRNVMAYFCGWDQEGFQNALREMGTGE